MREVLFVTYYFPPMGGSGVMRVVKLAKYLPQLGWKPTVLTVAGGDAFVFDDALLDGLPEDVAIHRAPSFEIIKTTKAKSTLDRIRTTDSGVDTSNPLRKRLSSLLKSVYFSLFIPDNKIGWMLPAVRKGLVLASRHDFEVIFATSPPQTNLLVATRLKNRLHTPLVVDYRDEWTTNPHKMIPNAVARWLHRALERRVLNSADAITVVSEGMLDNLRGAQLLAAGKLGRVVPNGFDPADFELDRPESTPSPAFSIVYTGSFYGEYRVPDPFLHGLHVWLTGSPQAKHDVQVDFYGSIYPRHQALVDDLQLDGIVRVKGQVTHQQAIRAQQNASVLLLVIGIGEGKAILTGKVFEYLGAARPVLALVPPGGEAAALIAETGAGIVVDPANVAQIARTLQDLYAQWRSGGIRYAPRAEKVGQYSRWEQARQLCDLFQEVTSAGER